MASPAPTDLDAPNDPWLARRTELAALLGRVALGDRAAFGRVYELAAPHLYAMLIRMSGKRPWADDVLQECFVNVWRHAARFDPNRSSPMTWMTAIARNAALDLLRRRDSDEAPLDEEAAQSLPDERPGPFDLLAADHDAKRVGECLRALPAPHRQSVSLAFYHGLSHAEIAAQLAQPLGTVKSWVRRGLMSIKKCLGG